MSLPDNIVGYRTSSGIQRFMETSDWHLECAELWPNHRFYCASNVVSQLAIESTKRELKLADLELQVKTLKQGKRVLSEAELRQRREAGVKARRNVTKDKNGRFIRKPATPLHRYIPERPWYQWFVIRLWDRLEKFFTGKQS